MGETHLQEGPLDLLSLLSETEDPSCGALVVFSGTVRNHHNGRAVTGLEYSAHPTLAEAQLRAVEQAALERFDIAQCRIVHRVGALDVGEDSVFVVVRSAHRGEAFEAARWAIDTLKESVPVWKREHYADGEPAYQAGTPLKDVGSGDGAT